MVVQLQLIKVMIGHNISLSGKKNTHIIKCHQTMFHEIINVILHKTLEFK